jgi:hypothetical protein
MMTGDINHYKELLPEYINGRLDAETAAHLEKQIRADDDLKKELEELRLLKKSYDGLPGTIQGPSPAAFSRIMQNIEALENPGRKGLERHSSFWDGFRSWIDAFRDWAAVPGHAWTFAGVQMAVIVVMAVVLLFSPADHAFQTLSTDPPLPPSMAHINVVFDGTAMEKEIRELLTGLNVSIVDGPGRTGLYVIAVPDGQSVDQVIVQLKNSEIITFVQKKI